MESISLISALPLALECYGPQQLIESIIFDEAAKETGCIV